MNTLRVIINQPMAMTNNTRYETLKKQATRFTIVGAVAALVHFLILITLVRLIGLAPAWGNIGAFLVAFVTSFSGHFLLTFSGQTRYKNWHHALSKWFVSSVSSFFLNQALFMLGLHYLGQLYYPVIWLFVTALVTLLSFVLGRQWAFKV